MAAESTEPIQTPLGVDDAFSVLGSETRIQILQALGDVEGPISFSELRSIVGIGDSGQFNYHLDKLDGRFLGQTDEGYRLLESGRRVVEAIYSGVLTDDPGISQIQIDRPCPFCGSPIVVRVVPGAITSYCSDCPGVYGETTAGGTAVKAERGYLGKMSLPPAGFNGRTPEEIYRAAQVWSHLELLAMANEVCPRCSATLEHELEVCENHDTSEELCSACDNRHPIMLNLRCTNCIFAGRGDIGILLYGHHAVQAFKVGHGENLVAPSGGKNPISNQEQEVLSVDPFSARVTYRFEGDAITMAIDEALTVTEVTE